MVFDLGTLIGNFLTTVCVALRAILASIFWQWNIIGLVNKFASKLSINFFGKQKLQNKLLGESHIN
jgi:hypothetical protein